tara:strand:+ start:238 stop:510 length:273 start_codon:yes stop_codon:yes gene_type:complete
MITYYAVGGYPRKDNDAYWVVQHPAGTKRWCYTANYRDDIVANFEEADGYIQGSDFRKCSERIAFEIELEHIERYSIAPGYYMNDRNGRK